MQKDENMKMLLELVIAGYPDRKEEMPQALVEYWKYRDTICVVDEVLLCGTRTLIPPSLREEVLTNLHAAHQGVEGMTIHAQSRVVWP